MRFFSYARGQSIDARSSGIVFATNGSTPPKFRRTTNDKLSILFESMLPKLRVLFLLIVPTMACHRHPGEDALTAADWEMMSDGKPECLGTPPFAPVKSEENPWTLSKPSAFVRLPEDMQEVPTQIKGARTWSGRDSSRFEYTVTSFPMAGGMASSGGVKVTLEGECALPVSGHKALTMRMHIDNKSTGTTLYAAQSTVMLADNLAINVWVESRDAWRREQLLRAFSKLELR